MWKKERSKFLNYFYTFQNITKLSLLYCEKMNVFHMFNFLLSFLRLTDIDCSRFYSIVLKYLLSLMSVQFNFMHDKICIYSLKNIRLKWIMNPIAFYSDRVIYKGFSRLAISTHLSSRRQSWVIRRLNYTCGSCSTFPSTTLVIGNERGAGLISADPYLLSIGPIPPNRSCTQRDDEFLISRKYVSVNLRLVHTNACDYRWFNKVPRTIFLENIIKYKKLSAWDFYTKEISSS